MMYQLEKGITMNNWELSRIILDIYSTPKVTEEALDDPRLAELDREHVKKVIRALRLTGMIRDIYGERRTLLSVTNQNAITDDELRKIANEIDSPKRPSPPLFGED